MSEKLQLGVDGTHGVGDKVFKELHLMRFKENHEHFCVRKLALAGKLPSRTI